MGIALRSNYSSFSRLQKRRNTMSRLTRRMAALVETVPSPSSGAPATNNTGWNRAPEESELPSLTMADVAELSEAFFEIETTKGDWSKPQ
jgi:hypothetical protein